MANRRARRTLAFDEGPFTFADARVPVVGVMTRGTLVVEAVVVGSVEVDGWDATEEILRLAAELPGSGPDLVLVDGITLGGVNLVDLDGAARQLGVPVLGVTRTAPDRARMEAAVRRGTEPDRRVRMLPQAPPVQVAVGNATVFVQAGGLAAPTPEDLRILVADTFHEASIPEPIRLAHHVATAMVRGVSGTRP